MPLYEYYCQPCDGIFEAIRPIREASEPAPCPVCNKEGKRMMPTSFSAFTYRDGYPRRIPDKGTYWHLGKEVKSLITGPVRPNEHPEVNKPEPAPRKAKGQVSDERERKRIERQHQRQEKREREAAAAAYEARTKKRPPQLDV
ncbi:MAG: FmdB family zinc ribbon protein [Dehalococcoidia bacterium]